MQLTFLIWGKSAEKAKHKIIETNGNHAADASAHSKLFSKLKKKKHREILCSETKYVLKNLRKLMNWKNIY